MKNRNRNKFSRDMRVAEAKVRNDKFAALSPSEQVAALDAKLGVGVGAAKQRMRLSKTV